jgi:DNA repair exonuclease SbcCD ATPase subunit
VQSLASGDPGGVGLPPRDSRTGRSFGFEEGMNEYEYAMMMDAEKMEEYGMRMDAVGSTPSTRSSGERSSTARTRRTPRTSRTITNSHLPSDQKTFLFRLNVHLPEDVKPLAKEYMNALVDNLRQALTNAYDEYEKKLQDFLQFAESRRDRAQSRLNKAMEQTKATGPTPVIEQNPADAAVHELLEQIIDLSNLSSSTSFADVIEQLKTAVDPPLQIQPNWKDLLENAEVEQATPAGMDPLTGIKLRKALEILLDGVSGDFAELKYVVDEGVILIATADSLPSKMIARVYEIPAAAYSAGSAKDLIDTIQNTIDPESWFDMSDMGEATITPYPSQRPRKLAILQTYDVHQKIQKFLESIKMDVPAGTPLEVPEEMLLSEKNNLLRENQNLEMELARLQGRMPAIEEQIMRIKKEIDQKVNADQVSEELRNIIVLQEKYLEEYKRLIENDTASLSGLAEKLARAKIELARRREQIGVSAGADQLAKFSNELATLAIDTAEKKAMLQIVSNQLNRIEQQLTASTTLDPQVSQIRLAVRALEIADKRVNELNTLALNVQPPTVSVLGAE